MKLLKEAKQLLFDELEVPTDRMERYRAMKEYPDDGAANTPWCVRLEEIDKEYWKNPDQLSEKIGAFAEAKGLIDPFRNPANKSAAPNSPGPESLP